MADILGYGEVYGVGFALVLGEDSEGISGPNHSKVNDLKCVTRIGLLLE